MKFNNIGVAETTANLLSEFNIPEPIDINDISNKYGKVILANLTLSWNFSASCTKPGKKACNAVGINISINRVNINKIINIIEKILTANLAESFLSPTAKVPENIGTKAEFKAPSAKIRLKKLGKRNTPKNTSAKKPVPRYLAIKTSLTKPSILERSVKKLTTSADLKNDISYLF